MCLPCRLFFSRICGQNSMLGVSGPSFGAEAAAPISSLLSSTAGRGRVRWPRAGASYLMWARRPWVFYIKTSVKSQTFRNLYLLTSSNSLRVGKSRQDLPSNIPSRSRCKALHLCDKALPLCARIRQEHATWMAVLRQRAANTTPRGPWPSSSCSILCLAPLHARQHRKLSSILSKSSAPPSPPPALSDGTLRPVHRRAPPDSLATPRHQP